jgi:Holliday junction resolvasome RuvABC endonuclease subunit
MSRAVILGLDAQMPGIGFGVVDATTGEALLAGWRPVVQEGWFEHRAIEALARTDESRHGWHIAWLVVERVAGGRGVQSMLKVANCAGIVAGVAVARWPDAALWRPSPGEWKKAAGMKGNATKRDVAALARDLLRTAGEPADDLRQDAYDALVMARAAYNDAVKAAAAITEENPL